MTKKRELKDINIKRVLGYLGAKVNLYPFLFENIIKQSNKNKKLFIDLFGGTAAVSKLINTTTDLDIIINDLAPYTKILSSELELNKIRTVREVNIFFQDLNKNLQKIDQEQLITNGDFFNEFSMEGKPKTITDLSIFNIKKKIKDENGKIIEEKEENNQKHQTSRMFFRKQVGQKIDTIRKLLKKNDFKTTIKSHNELMKRIILLFLLNYANKNANTTSVYGAYLKHDKLKERENPFLDKKLEIYLKEKALECNKNKITVYNDYAENVLESFSKVNTGVNKYKNEEIIIYWDPPYSSRSYESNYHILEYLIDLDFDIKIIKENSKTGMKKSEDKNDSPFASKIKTPIIFKELIKESMNVADIMYISYSNEGLLSINDIEKILEELNEEYFKKHKLELKVHKQEYKRFTSGENLGSNTGNKSTVEELIFEINKLKG
jgi:adenine-specific DNA-methyltransferase